MAEYMTMRSQRRFAKFSIPVSVLLVTDCEVISAFMSRFLVIRAECMMSQNSIEYEVLGLDFDPVPLGQMVPRYELQIENDDRGNITRLQLVRLE